MKFQYEQGSGWGKVKLGEKTFDARVFLGYVGLLFWLSMLFVTGGAFTFVAISKIALFLLILLAVTIPVRTIPLKNLYALFFYGAFAMGFATLLCKFAHMIFTSDSTSYTLVPLIETPFFLAPALVFLWLRRKFSLWELGAADILLTFAFAGAGYEIVELAAVANSASGSLGNSPLIFIPTAYEAGDRIRGLHFQNGQAVWATVAGATIALASFFRSKPWCAALAASGTFWVWLDHFGVNFQVEHATLNSGGAIGFLVNLITGDGRYSTYLCFLAIIGCVGFDYYVINRKLPQNLKLTISKYAKTFSKDWLYYVYANRRLAFSYFRATITQGKLRDSAIRMFAIGRERMIRYGVKPVALPDQSETAQVSETT